MGGNAGSEITLEKPQVSATTSEALRYKSKYTGHAE